MLFEDYFLLSTITIGIISAAILLLELRKFGKRVPELWKKSTRKIRLSIFFLMNYLIIMLFCETISCYFAANGIYNHFVASICYTLTFPFLLGFFFIHTQTKWKRYSYFIIYLSLIIHLIYEGCYHANMIMTVGTILFICSAQFIVTLLHLTDLLLNPKTDFFKFQLQINLTILVRDLIATIMTTSFISGITKNSDLIFYIQFISAIIFYLLFALLFTKEAFKLQRGQLY